jgi:hypothetical protein
MANTKISGLNILGKASFANDDYILVARGTTSNAKVQATSLLPTLTNLGGGSNYLLSLASQTVFSQKQLLVSGGILALANNANDLTLSINQGSINLSSCNNNANFLTTVNLASNVTGVLPKANGGTGLSSLTANSIMTVNSSGNMQSTALTTNGQLLIGGASGPVAATIQAGSNISVVNTSGGIQIAATIPASVVSKTGNDVIINNGGGLTAAGNITFSDSTKGLVYSNKNTVTQGTSLSTTVTLNATAGKINIFPTALAAETQVEFTVNNSTVTADSLIFVTMIGPGIAVEANTGHYELHVSQIAAGSFKVVLSNTNSTHATDTGARSVQFLVIN